MDLVVPFNLLPYFAFIKLTLWPENPLCNLSHSLLKSSFIKYRLFHASVKTLCKSKGNFTPVGLETHLSQLLKCNVLLLHQFLEDHKNAVLQKTQM